MALSEAHGASVRAMEADGLAPDVRLDWLAGSLPSIHDEAGAAVSMTGAALAELQLDALLLVGDRYETLAAALAATIARLPLVHLHGGEETEAAFDNAIRHAITKLSHLHFVSHVEYGRRIVAMGEDPSTVHVVGAPGLDNLYRDDLPGRGDLEQRLGVPLAAPVVIVTLHPSTLGGDPEVEVAALAAAMDEVEATYVITLPNNDPGGSLIRAALLRSAKAPRRVACDALGDRFYWALLGCADAMLGNSSSGILEAPAVALPVVNVGDRQRGRIRAPNVIDVPAIPQAIVAALRNVLGPGFRASVASASRTTFGDGRAGERIVEVLETWSPPNPPIKRRSFVMEDGPA